MFDLVTKFKPTGDQPQAIKKLCENIKNGMQRQTLLGQVSSRALVRQASSSTVWQQRPSC